MTVAITGVEEPAEDTNISIESRVLRSSVWCHDILEP